MTSHVISSPFNFIELNQKVFPAYNSTDEVPDMGELNENMLSGEINYSVQLITPLLLKDHENKFTASMMRGLVRSNLQILGFTSVQRDIEDKTFKFRGLSSKSKLNRSYYAGKTGAGVTRDNRRTQTIYRSIRAGIMRKEGPNYYIDYFHNDSEYGYYKLKISSIQRKNIRWRENFNVSYEFYDNIFDSVSHDNVRSLFKRKNSLVIKKISEPFIKKVSWEKSKSGDEVTAVGEYGKYTRKAYILNPGNTYGSDILYLIPYGKSDYDWYEVSDKAVKIYKENLKRSKYRGHSNYTLPKDGEAKPVFFLLPEEQNAYLQRYITDFGFTLLFPVNYKHSVKKGIPGEHFSDIIDYDMAVFGFKNSRNYYGGRVSFMEPVPETPEDTVHAKIFIYPPKANSIESYTEDKDGMGYNSDSFRLKGIKQYWLHESAVSEKTAYAEAMAEVSGIAAGTRYKGKIRFYNLRDDELGLLLWSLSLNEGCDQNIGTGKQYGYGRIRVSTDEVTRNIPPKKLPVSVYGNLTQKKLDSSRYIQIYMEKLNVFLEGNINRSQRLKDFFLMKTVKSVPDEEKLKYSALKDYRRKYRFPEIREVSTSKEWVLIPEQAFEEIIEMNWSEFVASCPETLQNYHPEKELYDGYKTLLNLTEQYHVNKHYIIRKEIVNEYLELNAVLSGLINQYNENRHTHRNNPFYKNMETCVYKTEELIETITRQADEFEKSRVPVLTFRSCNTFFDAENSLFRTTIDLSISSGSAPIKINNFAVEKNGKKVLSENGIRYIDDCSCTYFEIELPVSEEEKSNELIEYQTVVSYDIKSDTAVNNMEFSFTMHDILEAGDFRMLENPYSSWRGNPVSDRNMFFGRDEMLSEITEQIESCSSDNLSGRNIIIYGQKRTGKSTMIHFIKDALENNSDRYIVVDFGNVASVLGLDKSGDSGEKVSLSLFFRKLINQVEDAIEDNDEDLYEELEDEDFVFPELQGLSEAECMLRCSDFFERLVNRVYPEKRIVILIDEFTYFYDLIIKHRLDENFMRFWKAFIQNTKICAVLIGQDFMDEFIGAYPNEFGSSSKIRINYLDKNSTLDLIQKPFSRANNDEEGFTSEALDRIYELTAGNAYFTMDLCSELVSYINEKKQSRKITGYIVDLFMKECLLNQDSSKRKDIVFFESLYNDGKNREWDEDNIDILHEIAAGYDENGWVSKKAVIENITQNSNISFAEMKTEHLINRDVVIEVKGRLHIKVQLFAEWLLAKYSD